MIRCLGGIFRGAAGGGTALPGGAAEGAGSRAGPEPRRETRRGRPGGRREAWRVKPGAWLPPHALAARLLLGGGLFLGCVLGAGAQATDSGEAAGDKAPVRLTVERAVELALENNLSLESQLITLDTKKRKVDLVWNQFLPTLSVSGTLSMANKESTGSTVYPVDLSEMVSLPKGSIYGVVPVSYDVPRWAVMGSFQASLQLSAAMIQGIETLRRDYQAGLVTLEKLRSQTERDVRKSYNQILLLHAQAELLEESLASAQSRYETALTNYDAGLTPRLSVLQAQVQVETMQPSIIEMENGIKALEAQFAMTLGLDYDTRFDLEPLSWTLTDEGLFNIPLDLASLISRAAAGRLDILELQANLATLQAQRKAQALQLHTPYLALSWAFTPTFLGDPWKDTWFDADKWSDSGRFSLTLGITLNSLFSFTKEGQGIKDLDNQIASLSLSIAQVLRGSELEIYTKVNSLEKTRVTAEAQAKTLALAEETYRLTETAYSAGYQDASQVRDAALSRDQARLQLVVQQFNYLNDLIDLEYYTGVPFGALTSSLAQTTAPGAAADSRETGDAPGTEPGTDAANTTPAIERKTR